MNRPISLNFVVITALSLLFSCSGNSGSTARHQSSKTSVQFDTSLLAEKNFIYRNLTSTASIGFFTKPVEKGIDLSAGYADFTLKKEYFRLSGEQAGALIAPFLPEGYGVKYVKEEMFAWLISKQANVNGYQPIIVKEIGIHDYEALQLIILNKQGKPIDEFDLDEENPFPDHGGYPYKYHSYSLLNKNEIKSYRISESTDSAKRQVTVDSNVFQSVIGTNGKIMSRQIVKSRITKSLLKS